MKFVSTRGQTPAVSFSEAVALGLAPDGGLFVPEAMPDLSDQFSKWKDLEYEELCFEFLRHFATDIEPKVLREIVAKSYGKFDDEEIAPLKQLSPDLFILELFHGPTLAFKDFALQLLGNLYEYQIEKTGRPITVLGATSGDTGAAAIHGLLGKSGVRIFILYPDGRISPLQERQMACTGEGNVYPLAVEGSFDDTQMVLKEAFGDQAFREEVNLSAVNSINLARVLAQCVYYIYGYWRLPESVRTSAEFVVPTGNFGNILAGWLVQQMGLPINSFRVATNQNDILHRLFSSGNYVVHDVSPSLAPSMDIQVASNFERFIYFAEGESPEKVRNTMDAFKAYGEYEFVDFESSTFTSSRTTDTEIRNIITKLHQEYSYVADPHTACGLTNLDSGNPQVVLSTAHPAKFPETIVECIGSEPKHPSLEALKTMPVVKHKVASDVDAVKTFIRQSI